LPENGSPTGTVTACGRSLDRLGIDRLDRYLLYWRGSYPIEGTIVGFEHLRRQGKILSWGVSNFDVADLEELWSLVGWGHVACDQVLYNLRERSIEHAVIPCEEHGISVVGYVRPYRIFSGPPEHTAENAGAGIRLMRANWHESMRHSTRISQLLPVL
jgi:diketogulonate reductase-like aldo/keto reductase